MPDGRPVHRHMLSAACGTSLYLLELGAAVHRLDVRDHSGGVRNVALGHPTINERLASTHYLGATIGRYANRIRGGRFELDGRRVQVPANDRGHNLHGGPEGFDRQLWRTAELSDRHVVFEHESPAGHQGFPGRLCARVRYEVAPGWVRISYHAVTDAPTVVNLTNHTYFNLDGEGSGTIARHVLTVPADQYTPTDENSIPRARNLSVVGTPFDFRSPVDIASSLSRTHSQLRLAGGIDHNMPVPGSGLRLLASVESLHSGIRLELSGTQPGLQVYTGNNLDGRVRGTSGITYTRGAGIALEPQNSPDAPNRPSALSSVLRPGENYETSIEWKFITRAASEPAASRVR